MAGEQPKKPVGGAYGVFMAEKRPEFAKACEGKKASEVSKMGGAAWKKLSEADKAPYEKMFQEKKKKFEEDMKKFLDAGGEKQKGLRALRTEKRKEKEGKTKKGKDPDKPKKPAGGAYGIFVAENRERISAKLPKGSPATAVSKPASAEWKKMSDADKKPYQDKYEKKKKEYEEAMKNYKPKADDDGDDDEEEEEEAEEEEKPAPKKKAKKA